MNQFRENYRKNVIPSWYHGVLHLIFNFGILLGLQVFFFLGFYNQSLGLYWLIFPLILISGNFAVWTIHRYPLHKRLKFMPFAYDIHSKEHHQFYTYNTLIYEGHKDWYILFFPPTVVLGFALTFIPIGYFLGGMVLSEAARDLFLFSSALYFMLYEIVHYCCHLPEGHWALKFPLFGLMWRHHKIHHHLKLMHSYNFGIVFPFADYLLGTNYKGEISPEPKVDLDNPDYLI